MPKFPDVETWQQAEQLMQPAFIRLIDNLRKQLEQSSWKGTYEDVPLWAEDVSDDVKLQVTQLQEKLQSASAEDVIAIEAALAQLPSAHTGYHLHLEQADQRVTVDLWNLCYQICFKDYDAASGMTHALGETSSSQTVSIDTDLFEETGAVDWNRLDRKTQQIVEQVFGTLPETHQTINQP
ncbi:hypothetical protein H6F76_20985 [Leptolyngbya sp. FACHB-321]|uniref:hypothetical protein n=1 Tax=Leptolyngbya sp. FACHB-321 TaxID=2692807 RepID=UPI0016856EB5|nr:hypothetical protein [Leptolyngbya sp. FACHB-321]MBD2037440.1 hypothetical protein [Leptolyngbya sp. FACHB-321]